MPDATTSELLQTHFNYDVAGGAQTPSPVYRYFENTSAWLVYCLFSLMPLSMLVVAVCRRRCAREGVLLGLVGTGLVVGQILCSHIISFRYLHPFPVIGNHVPRHRRECRNGSALWTAAIDSRTTGSRTTGVARAPANIVIVQAFGVAPSARRRTCSA